MIEESAIRNRANDWNPESGIQSTDKDSRIHGVDPESKTVLDSLTWGDFSLVPRLFGSSNSSLASTTGVI